MTFEEMNRKHFVVELGKQVVIGNETGDQVLFHTERALSLYYRNHPPRLDTRLPPALFKRFAVILFKQSPDGLSPVNVVYRNPRTGEVYKNPRGLDLEFRQRHVLARWLADPRRRTLEMPYRRGRFVLTDAEWAQVVR